MATTENNTPISYITTTGLSIFAQAIGGSPVTIAKAYLGSDIITSYTQAQLQALNNTVTNGAAGTVYVADSNLITYSFPSSNTIQFKINLDATVGNFEIGNWGLVDSNGNMLCITALAKQDSKTATSSTSVGDNRVYTINIPVTSELTSNIDFSVIGLDAASLPEVATEAGLPAANTASYPVFHVQDYDGTNYPALASRVDNTWYYYLTLDGILARNNTWTGTDTFNNTVTLNAASYAAVAPTASYNLTDTTIPNAGWVASNYISNSLGIVSANGDLKGAGLHSTSEGTPVFGYYNGVSATSVSWEYLATQSYVSGEFLTINNPTGYGTFTLGGNLGTGSINLGSYSTAGSSIINFFSSGSGVNTVDANLVVSGGKSGTLYDGSLTVNSSVFNISGELITPTLAYLNGGINVSKGASISGNTSISLATSPVLNNLDLQVPSGALGRNSQLGFHGTFDNNGTDTNSRLISVIDSAFISGSWGSEQLRFWINNGQPNDIASTANMVQVLRLNYLGAAVNGSFTVTGNIEGGYLTSSNNIYLNNTSVCGGSGPSNEGSYIYFGTDGHIDICDNLGVIQSAWSMSDGNTPYFISNCKAQLLGGAISTTPSTSDNSTNVATTAYVQNNLENYVSGVSGMGSGDSQGIWLHLNGSTKHMNAGYSGGDGDLAWYSDITSVESWVEGNYFPITGGTLEGNLQVSPSSGEASVSIGSFGSSVSRDQATLYFYQSGNTTASDAYIRCIGGSTSTGNNGGLSLVAGSLSLDAHTVIYNTTTTAKNTLDLQVSGGALGQNSQLGFHATFDNSGGTDYGSRLTSVIDSTFSGGSWGTEQLRFWVNNGNANDAASMSNMNEVMRLNGLGLAVYGSLSCSGNIEGGSLTTGNNIYLNGTSLCGGSSISSVGSYIQIPNGEHIEIHDSQGTLQSYWSMSDGNTPFFGCNCAANLYGGAWTTTADTSDNSTRVATTAYVQNQEYVSGTYGMNPDTDTRILGIHIDDQGYVHVWDSTGDRGMLEWHSTDTSDPALKDNMKIIYPNILEDFDKINMYSFDWKDGYIKKGHVPVGFNSKNLLSVWPDTVRTIKGNPDTIDVLHLVAKLTAAIKQLKDKVIILEGKN